MTLELSNFGYMVGGRRVHWLRDRIRLSGWPYPAGSHRFPLLAGVRLARHSFGCLRYLEASVPRRSSSPFALYPFSSAIIVSGTICQGKPFHSSPSRRRRSDLGRGPPHYIKKNAAPKRLHANRNSVAHAGAIGHACGPLPPPTMARAMSVKSTSPKDPRSGSNTQTARPN